MQDEEKKVLDRLARVEGQVRALRKMLEEQRCCEDVLTQLVAARSGLEQAGILVIERHLENCILQEDVSAELRAQIHEVLRMWTRHAVASG